MHDINGKTLFIGSEVFSYGFGLCKIVEVKDENNIENQGALVVIQNDKGKLFEARVRASYMKKVRSWSELAQVGLDIQKAVNLAAVVSTFTEVIVEVQNRLVGMGQPGSVVGGHPVCILFCDKIAELSGVRFNMEKPPSVQRAYEWAYDVTASNRQK